MNTETETSDINVAPETARTVTATVAESGSGYPEIGDLVRDRKNNVHIVERVGAEHYDARGWGFASLGLRPASLSPRESIANLRLVEGLA